MPQIHGGIIAAWVAVFVFTFGELGTTVLITPPGESTLPVRVYTLIANAPPGNIAALALLQVLATVVPLCVFGLTLGRIESRP
jgi:ABC-type spermidine/putrescine transport system permease subunit II